MILILLAKFSSPINSCFLKVNTAIDELLIMLVNFCRSWSKESDEKLREAVGKYTSDIVWHDGK